MSNIQCIHRYSARNIIERYIFSKDSNKPCLMELLFSENATLLMKVKSDAVDFPSLTSGSDNIAGVLARQFGAKYDNVYTFCDPVPEMEYPSSHHCNWWVFMTNKKTGSILGGQGLYDWRFSPITGQADSLNITIDNMDILPEVRCRDLYPVLVKEPYPWNSNFALALEGGIPKWLL